MAWHARSSSLTTFPSLSVPSVPRSRAHLRAHTRAHPRPRLRHPVFYTRLLHPVLFRKQRRVDQVPRSLARRLYAAVVGTHDDVVPYVVLLRGLTRVFKTATPRERSAVFLDVVLDTPRATPDRATRAELRRALGWLLMAAATFREPAMEPPDAPTPGRLTRDEEERWLPELQTAHQRVVDPILRGVFPDATDADIALDDLLNWQLSQGPSVHRRRCTAAHPSSPHATPHTVVARDIATTVIPQCQNCFGCLSWRCARRLHTRPRRPSSPAPRARR